MTAYLENAADLPEDVRRYVLKNDDFYVLKQVSSGNRVAVCFRAASDKYREQATEACFQDSLGRRDAPYEVAGFDPCGVVDGTTPERKAELQNLYCVVISGN